MIFRICRYIGRHFYKIKCSYLRWKQLEYLNGCGACTEDPGSFALAPTVVFHADSKLKIGRGLTAGEYCEINSNDSFGIYMGRNVLLADHVYIRGANHDWSYSEEPFQGRGHLAKKVLFEGEEYSVVIEDNVWIAHGATIISGAHIGKGSVIGANAVVGGAVPAYSVVIGNPAQIVSDRRKHMSFDDREDMGLFL